MKLRTIRKVEIPPTKYVMIPRSYYRVIVIPTAQGITHLDNLDVGAAGDFSHCGHYSKNWKVLGSLKDHEITCKTCQKQLTKMDIFPWRSK